MVMETFKRAVLFGVFALLGASSMVQAQDVPVTGQDSAQETSETQAVKVEEKTDAAKAPKAGFKPSEYASLVFTYWEHTAILDARRSRGMVRAPTEAELMRDLKTRDDGIKVKPPPEARDIRLSGIAYRSENDWTIWLNDQRVTPNALPREIIDLRVFDEYIEMKWFDDYTNQIFPIRLRPHQRFNIDTRIFLPG